MHKPKQALNKFMMREVNAALADCDAILFVVDVSQSPGPEDRRVAEMIAQDDKPKLMAMNKSDRLDPRFVVANVAAYAELLGPAPVPVVEGAPERHMLTSGTRGDNLDKLHGMLLSVLPEGPAFYPADQYTDQTQRIIAAELVREQVLKNLDQEVPHAIAVSIEEYQTRNNGTIYIAATIYVERPSQKGILIGHNGEMLKKIGAATRKEIEREVRVNVYLELWVKVREKWRDDDGAVERFLSAEI